MAASSPSSCEVEVFDTCDENCDGNVDGASKCVCLGYAAVASKQSLPHGFDFVSQRSNPADAGDDGAPVLIEVDCSYFRTSVATAAVCGR
ncbi:MAG: hypothetical protein R3E58_16095 [Phycisphaerae bacterium]